MAERDKFEYYSYHESGELVRQTTIIRLLQAIKNETKDLEPSYDGLQMTKFDFIEDNIGGILINYIHESSPYYPFVLATIISYEQVSKEDDIAVFKDYIILGHEEGLAVEKFEHIIDKSDSKWQSLIDPNQPDLNYIQAAMSDLNENKFVEDSIGSNIVTDDEVLNLLDLIKFYKK